MMLFKRSIAALAALVFSAAAALAQGTSFPAGTLWGNDTAAARPGKVSTVTSILDRALGSTRGSIMERGAGGWAIVGPSATVGLAWISQGAGADPVYGVVGLAGGGCAAALTASNGGILYSTAAACAVLPGTATARQMLQSGASAAPAWSTTTWPATSTANRILYSSANNVIGEITSGNNSLLVTDGSGVPSVSTTIPNGVAATTQSIGDNTTKVATTAYVDRIKKVISSNKIFYYGPGGSNSNDCTDPSTNKCLDKQGAYDNLVDNWIVKGKNTLITIQADTNTAYTDALITGRCVQGQNTTATVQFLGQAQTTATITVTIATPGVITWTAHGFSANQPFYLTNSGGALPTNATAFTKFYVKTVLDPNTFTFSATAGGAAINTTGSQSGTHTGTSLSNTSITTTNSDAFSVGATANGAGTTGCTQIAVGGFAVGTITSGNAFNKAGGGVGLTVGITGYPIEFTATAQDHLVGNHFSWGTPGTNNIVSGGALIHIAALSGGLEASHNTGEVFLTVNGVVPAFTYFAYADIAGLLYVDNMTFTNSSIVTGIRYLVQNFAQIYTLSASASYLPGNSAGARQSFGNYVTNVPSTWANADLANSATTVAGQTCTLGSTCGLGTASNALAADVLLNNTANFFDGPSMAQGTSGTWFASGSVLLNSSTADFIQCKLWDGTTVIASSNAAVPAGSVATLSLSGYLASPAANIRISCKDGGTVNGKILFNNTGVSKDATIYGFRTN